MNLTTEPWIPIIGSDSRPGNIGLREAFERGEKVRDLAVRPHERIALMRLLICIAQAALDGPTDHDDWESCRPQIIPAALDYLSRWQKSFELVGTHPLVQFSPHAWGWSLNGSAQILTLRGFPI